jgi:hypothetical protein
MILLRGASASGALVKESKSSKFYIEKNIIYTLKKGWLHKFQDNFTTFDSLTSTRGAMFKICHFINVKLKKKTVEYV